MNKRESPPRRTDEPALFGAVTGPAPRGAARGGRTRWRAPVRLAFAMGLARLAVGTQAQTYDPPAAGNYGANGPLFVSIAVFTNPVHPVANGETLRVSVYHPNANVDPSWPTIFFAHGYTSPIGSASDYSALLIHLASRGYNVVFSPYEGGLNPSIALRFDELTTGFEAAVTKYALNTSHIGFVGHSYGAGFLPSVIRHEMMGQADQFTAGNLWGGVAAFMYSMAPGYAYSGGGGTSVAGAQTISFPANLNVIEQVFNDDKSVADPRLALDVFYNITTLNRQKEFVTVHGDSHGTPPQVANHFLPVTGAGVASTSLQAWAVFRHIDALAAYTFTGDSAAHEIALGNGTPAETYEGAWSDGTDVARLGVTDAPAPDAYFAGPYAAQWSDAANPRGVFPLVTGPPRMTGVKFNGAQVSFVATGLLSGHSYLVQTATNTASGNWSNALSFVPSQGVQSFNATIDASLLFFRIVAP